jgi:acyl-CoA dehydrogenase
MAWDFSTEPAFEEKLAWVRDFLRAEIYPLETLEIDESRFDALVRPLREQVKAQGLWAAHLPPELGGQGFGELKLALLNEEIGRSPVAPTVFGNQAPDSGNAELIAVAGTDEQKRRWMQPLLDGRLRSAFSMTEPHVAGSDPTQLTTTAVRDGDVWVIDGHKWFTSNGSAADFLVVMAVTDPEAGPAQRASMFIVPTGTPGVNILRDVSTMEHPAGRGQRFEAGGFGHAEIRYEQVRIPLDHLLGERGQGFALAQTRLGPGRLHHCMRWVGQCHRAFDMLCERAVSRTVQGGLLIDKQTVQNWIADSAADISAFRLMTLHAAWKVDQVGTRGSRVEISMIKYFGARVLHDVIDRAIQVHGGLGYSTDLPLEAMYRYARGARIYDGPDEVHRQTVARLVARGYQPAPIPTEHIPTRAEAAREHFASLLLAGMENA